MHGFCGFDQFFLGTNTRTQMVVVLVLPRQYLGVAGASIRDLMVPLGCGKGRFPDPKGTVSRRKGSQAARKDLSII